MTPDQRHTPRAVEAARYAAWAIGEWALVVFIMAITLFVAGSVLWVAGAFHAPVFFTYAPQHMGASWMTSAVIFGSPAGFLAVITGSLRLFRVRRG